MSRFGKVVHPYIAVGYTSQVMKIDLNRVILVPFSDSNWPKTIRRFEDQLSQVRCAPMQICGNHEPFGTCNW